jgi:predicted flap endonuclease-1-like 5' DNA nuclease
MKNSQRIAVLALLLVASVSLVVYPFALGLTTDMLVVAMMSVLLVGIFALVGTIALLASSTMQKKVPELAPQSPVIQASMAEPSPSTEESEEKPSPAPIDRGCKIADIEGIGPNFAEKLNAINIYTTLDLLAAGATPQGRKEIAEKTGISNKLILEWVNMADLFRIKGVGEEYSDLLEEAGVDTVVELATRVPENLRAKMLEVNEKTKLVRRMPTLNEVTQWVEEAKALPRKIEY